MTELETLKNTSDLTCSDAHDRVEKLDTLELEAEISDKYTQVVEYREKCFTLDYDDLKDAGSPYWEYFKYFLDVWNTDWNCVYYGHELHDEIGKKKLIIYYVSVNV